MTAAFTFRSPTDFAAPYPDTAAIYDKTAAEESVHRDKQALCHDKFGDFS